MSSKSGGKKRGNFKFHRNMNMGRNFWVLYREGAAPEIVHASSRAEARRRYGGVLNGPYFDREEAASHIDASRGNGGFWQRTDRRK